jgi:hypothetical protein
VKKLGDAPHGGDKITLPVGVSATFASRATITSASVDGGGAGGGADEGRDADGGADSEDEDGGSSGSSN